MGSWYSNTIIKKQKCFVLLKKLKTLAAAFPVDSFRDKLKQSGDPQPEKENRKGLPEMQKRIHRLLACRYQEG